jgi:hypothetical protein
MKAPDIYHIGSLQELPNTICDPGPLLRQAVAYSDGYSIVLTPHLRGASPPLH